MPEDDRNSNKLQDAAVTAARYSEVAFILPAAIFVGWLLGKYGDYLFHKHWLIVTGVIIGAIAGFVQLIRMVVRDKG